MSAAILESDGWSRAQWIGALSLIVMLHGLLLFILSERKAAPPLAGPPLSTIHFVDDPAAEPHLAEWLSLLDPMVFVQVDSRTFSRVSSLAKSHFSYELTNWTEPYRWIGPSDQYFADDFNLYVASAVRPSVLLTEKVPPALSQVASSTPVLPGHAVLRIEGDLAGRRLISTLPLPVSESRAILTNTVVGVRVDPSGERLWATLLFGSGLPKADQSALAFAKQARFEKVAGPGNGTGSTNVDSYAFGQFVFQWFPAPASDTNQPTAKP
ncbi:MAG: hypothetical protein L0Z50_35025 [Verrucomicrobiales bacterium]|nr:hypothetical protein [Verrucomicrobiales bacterium]